MDTFGSTTEACLAFFSEGLFLVNFLVHIRAYIYTNKFYIYIDQTFYLIF